MNRIRSIITASIFLAAALGTARAQSVLAPTPPMGWNSWDSFGHRHISHVFAQHPGRQITPLNTPELAGAARKSLELRGDEGTGWSKAWKINCWARLHDGDHAFKLVRQQLTAVDTTRTAYARGGMEVDLAWKNGKAVSATLRSTAGGAWRLRAPRGQKVARLRTAKGALPLVTAADGAVELHLQKGASVRVVFG